MPQCPSSGETLVDGKGKPSYRWYDFFRRLSPISQKGDLIVFGADNARLPVGTDGQVLTANSGAANGLGVDWETGGGGGGGANITPDTHPAVANAADDEFEFGSSIDLTGARRPGATPWTWENQSTGSTAVSEGSLVLTSAPYPGSSAYNLQIVYQPPTGAKWEYTIKVAPFQNAANSGSAGFVVGTVSGKLLGLYSSVNNGGSASNFQAQRWTSATSFNSTPSSAGSTGYALYINTTPQLTAAFWYYAKLSFDGTSLTLSASPTGVPGTFSKFYSEAYTTFLGAVPNLIGLGVISSNATGDIMQGTFDWFRKTA